MSEHVERITVKAEPLLVGVEDAGSMLGLSGRSVRRLIEAGELPSVLVGGRRLLAVDDLRTWTAGLARQGGAA